MLGMVLSFLWSIVKFCWPAYRNLEKVRKELKRIPTEFGEPLEEKERLSICLMNIEGLHKAIKNGSLTAEKIMLAFIQQAISQHKQTNCLCDERFEDAMDEARKADRFFEENKRFIGELHGIPFSVKESIKVKGWRTTLGLQSRVNQRHNSTSEVINACIRAGAIPFVHTNIQQLLLGMESSNPVFGPVKNPWNPARTSGGSSGGEAALISGRGAVFGIGTDIGGSVRMPAHFCGIFAIKPTGGMVTAINLEPSLVGQESIKSVVGPMSNCVDDLKLVYESILKYQKDITIPRVKENTKLLERIKNRNIRVGYFLDDFHAAAGEMNKRAVLEVIEKLREEGIECVEFQPPGDMQTMMFSYCGLVTADGGKTHNKMLHGSVRDSTLIVPWLGGLPIIIKLLLAKIGYLMGFKRIEQLSRLSGNKSIAGLWALQHQKNLWKLEFTNAFMDAELDFVISPSNATPAVPHGAGGRLVPLISYTALYNFIDWPAGVVPTGLVKPSDLVKKRVINDGWDRLLELAEVGSDSPPLPISVQVAAPPYCEDGCLEVMKLISELVPFKVLPPTINQ